MEVHVFELYPRHSHRTPAQIAEDAGGSFEPRRANSEKGRAAFGLTSASDTTSVKERGASATTPTGDQLDR